MMGRRDCAMNNLYSITYTLNNEQYETEQEFRSVSDFMKLLEIRNEDISQYKNIKKKG